MGGSGSWFKSLIPPKKPSTNNQVRNFISFFIFSFLGYDA
jgi:hypothetical protein